MTRKIPNMILGLLSMACVSLCDGASGEQTGNAQYAPEVYWADGYSGKMGIQTVRIPAMPDEPRMLLGGVPLYVTGVNCYNLFVQCHESDGMNTSLMERTVEILAENKVPIVRFSCSPYYASQMHFYTEDKEKYLSNLDRLGDLCDERKILLIPSVFWNTSCLPEYFSEGIAEWGNKDSKTYKFMVEYTRDIVNTLKRHKCLAAWEFGNEFNLAADIGIAGYPLITAAQVGVAYKGFADTVVANDPEGRMICTGNSVMRNSQWHQYRDPSWTTDSFDQYVEITGILTPSPMTGMSEHIYEDPRAFSDLGGNLSRTQQVFQAKRCAARNGKVYYVGEFIGPDAASNYEKVRAHYQVYMDQKVQLSLIWNYALRGDVEHSFSADTEAGRTAFGLMRECNGKFASMRPEYELPERPELFTRTASGTYRIHATTQAAVTGKGRVALTIFQPYPESNRYQDVTWLKEVPPELVSTYQETGHPFVRFAEWVNAPTTVDIDRDYVVTLYDVRFDWSAVAEIYPYDRTHKEYVRYTRRYPCDITDTNAYEAAYSWVAEKSAQLRKESADDLDYVRKAYATIEEDFRYGEWPGGFTNLIARKQGDCGGLSTAFVCLLRQGGVPARQMVCIRPDESPHVWPEFYLQNYGWIPVDFDMGRPAAFTRFGNYADSTIVMTYDVGFSAKTADGTIAQNVFVQGLAWSWFWWWEGTPGETERNFTLNTTWKGNHGMWTKDGAFIGRADLWRSLDTGALRPHAAFLFDGNADNVGTNRFALWNGQSCSYVKSPLGYAIRLDNDFGPWTDDDLKLGDDWTLMTMGRFIGVENSILFCVGTTWDGGDGFALAAGKTNEVTLSFWRQGAHHEDLITAAVPDSATKYHAYAIRVQGLDVSLYVDGVRAGKGRFPVRPPTRKMQLFTVHGGVGNTGFDQTPGGLMEDWRVYNGLLPDEMIMAYADLLLKYDEAPAGESVEGNVIPHAWIERNGKAGYSYGDACRQTQPNGYPLWQCYVAGLAPSDAESKLTASIEMVDGRPKVSVLPDLGSARRYTVLGSADMSSWSDTNADGPFFKVRAEMP